MIFANVLITAVLSVFTTAQPAPHPQDSDYLMEITQGNIIKKITAGTNTVRLNRAPFDLQFQLNNYKAGRNTIMQFAAFKESESLDFTSGGKNGFEVPYFAPQSGLPRPRRGPYQYLYLNKAGHHFLFYENETNRTTDMLTELDEGGYELKWTIDSVYENKKATAIKDISHNQIFCVAFFDKNKNKIVDEGEYAKIEIDFN